MAHEREFEILKKLTHANIVRAIEIFKDGFKNTIHQVIELIPGCELGELLLKNGIMGEEEAKFIFKQILMGLEYMHSKRVVNRDIKPANIMVQQDKRAVIIDFNVSKAGSDEPIKEELKVYDDSYSPTRNINLDEEDKEELD